MYWNQKHRNETYMTLFYGQNIEHGYIIVLFSYVIVMRYNTSLKIKWINLMRDTSILDVIHRCCAAYISFLTHSRVTLRCSIKRKDEEAEIACETGSVKVTTQFTRAFVGRCSLWPTSRTGRAVRKTTLDLDLSKILFAPSYMPWLICRHNRETLIARRTVAVRSSPPLIKKSTRGFRSPDNL